MHWRRAPEQRFDAGSCHAFTVTDQRDRRELVRSITDLAMLSISAHHKLTKKLLARQAAGKLEIIVIG